MPREPVWTALDERERELVEAAMERSRCRSLSEFVRSAAITTAHEVLDRAEQEREAVG